MLIYLLSVTDIQNKAYIESIYNNFRDDMFRLAKSRLKNAGIKNYIYDAEDAVQNAFYKIAKYSDTVNFNMPTDELKLYILTVTANETNNILNDIKYTEEIDDLSNVSCDEDFVDQINIRMNYERVVRAIDSMDERYSVTFYYKYCLDMSVHDIAALLGIAEQTVYSRLTRGKKILIEMFGKDELNV